MSLFTRTRPNYSAGTMLTNLPRRPRSRNSITPLTFANKRIVLAETHVVAGLDAGAALAHDDRAAGDQLAAERLHAQAL